LDGKYAEIELRHSGKLMCCGSKIQFFQAPGLKRRKFHWLEKVRLEQENRVDGSWRRGDTETV